MTLGWLSPAAQIWHVETALLAVLVVQIARLKDGRPRFEALMVCNLVFDVVGLATVRSGHPSLYLNYAWWWYLVGFSLTALAVTEAMKRDRSSIDRHATIMAWWVSGTIACLGVKAYPHSGRALLVFNSICYLCWILDKRRVRI